MGGMHLCEEHGSVWQRPDIALLLDRQSKCHTANSSRCAGASHHQAAPAVGAVLSHLCSEALPMTWSRGKITGLGWRNAPVCLVVKNGSACYSITGWLLVVYMSSADADAEADAEAIVVLRGLMKGVSVRLALWPCLLYEHKSKHEVVAPILYKDGTSNADRGQGRLLACKRRWCSILHIFKPCAEARVTNTPTKGRCIL